MGTMRTGYGRAKQKILAASGRAEETIDVEFELLLDTYVHHKELLEELFDDAKRFLSAANDFSQVQRKLADEVLELYEASAPMYNAGLAYQSGAMEMEKRMKEITAKWKEEFQDPLGAQIAQYEEMKSRVDTNDTRRVDMDRFFREYLEALEEPGHDPRRVYAKKVTYDEARDAYTQLTAELVSDMKALYEDRLKFLTPLFARLTIVHSELLTETQNLLKNVVGMLPKRPATAPDIHRLGSVITDEDSTAANGGTDYSLFMGAHAAGAVGGADDDASDEEDSGEARAEALAAAAAARGGTRQITEAPSATPVPPPTKPKPVPKVVHAVALFDFAGSDDDELPFRKGDVLTIVEQSGDWWQAQLDGKSGSIPANYVKLQ